MELFSKINIFQDWRNVNTEIVFLFLFSSEGFCKQFSPVPCSGLLQVVRAGPVLFATLVSGELRRVLGRNSSHNPPGLHTTAAAGTAFHL